VARVADGWLNSAQVTLEEALQLRDTIEAARKAQGTEGRPFQYYLRPYAPFGDTVPGFVREGFENLVLWGPDVWSNDPAAPLEAKVAKLEAIARELGVSSRVAEPA
jgi:hypothetical protein